MTNRGEYPADLILILNNVIFYCKLDSEIEISTSAISIPITLCVIYSCRNQDNQQIWLRQKQILL